MNRAVAAILTIVGLFLGVGACVWASGTDEVPLVLLGLIISPLMIFAACRFPEIMYALFVDAGLFKGDPRLTSLMPGFLDLTVTFGLLTLIGIIYNIVIRHQSFVRPPWQLVVPYSLFTIWAALSLSFTNAPLYGMDKFLRFATITSFALYAPFWLPTAKIGRAFTMFVLIAVAMVLDVFHTGIKPVVFETRSAFGDNYLSLGRATGMGFLIVVFWYLRRERRVFALLVYIVLSLILAAGVLLSGGRGPLLAAALTIGIIFLHLLGSIQLGLLAGELRRVQLGMAIVILVIVASTAIAASSYSEYFTATWSRLELLSSGRGDFSDGRIPRFSEAVKIATSWPTGVTGLGVGGFVMAYGGYDAVTGDYPHNIFLEIGSELGVIGMIAFLWMLGWTFSRWIALRRKARGNQLYLVYTLFAMLVFELVNACVSGDINQNRLLFGCLGLVVAFSARADRLRQSRNIVGTAELHRKYMAISLTGYLIGRGGAPGTQYLSGFPDDLSR